jgi:ketosteroid isomerase-like protein
MSDHNLQIIQKHYAASDRGDVKAMLEVLAPNAAWTEMAGFPYAGTYIGPQAVLDGVFKRIQIDWNGYKFQLERLCDAGDTIVALGQYSGTYKETGKLFQCRVAHVWQLKDDRVCKFEQFCDTLLVAQAMHRAPADASAGKNNGPASPRTVFE